jgi:hypothetical protein
LRGSILLFSLLSYVLMLAARALLPETKGRSLDSIVPDGITPLRPAPAGNPG